MVWTAAQVTAFFEDANQMALAHETRVHLGTHENINDVDDLADNEKDDWKRIADHLASPPGRIPDPNADPANHPPLSPAGPPMPTIRQPSLVFSAASQTRLEISAQLVRYYNTINRTISPAMMRWNPIGRDFRIAWKSLEDRKDADTPEVPKITRNLNVVKWSEAFADFLDRVVGARCIPLTYVTREQAIVVGPLPPLVANQPYSEEAGSVEQELILYADHSHPLYSDDNAKLYYFLEEATRGTAYAASLKPFQRAKNGRSAWRAITAQYAGEDKWRSMLNEAEQTMQNHKWLGNNNIALEAMVKKHRTAFVTMSQCSQHVPFQLPNQQTRVTHLLDNIQCNDATLQANMALVRADNGPTGKLNDFEAAAAFLLPACPVQRKKSGKGAKRIHADVSDASVSFNPKVTKGKTGVEFRFYTKAEYNKLSTPQKDELREYRNAKEEEGKGRSLPKRGGNGPSRTSSGPPSKKKMKGMIASCLKEALEEALSPPPKSEKQELHDMIVAALQQSSGDAAMSKPTPPKTAKSNADDKAQVSAVSASTLLQRIKAARPSTAK